VLSLPPSVRVFLAAGVTDMRKSFDGLAGLVRSAMGSDPLSGHLFAFCNRNRNRLKVLYWDTSGFCLLHKRLERGTFSWPEATEVAGRSVELDARELALLLSGLDLSMTRRRRWFERRA
jgi:transposase